MRTGLCTYRAAYGTYPNINLLASTTPIYYQCAGLGWNLLPV